MRACWLVLVVSGCVTLPGFGDSSSSSGGSSSGGDAGTSGGSGGDTSTSGGSSGGTTGSSCVTSGGMASSADECCSQEIDVFGVCCHGSTCCGPDNHSHADGSQCACDSEYEWASSDPADLTCVPAPEHVIECSGMVTRAKWCQCTAADSNLGATSYNGGCVEDPSFAPMKCCADTAYPGSGSCTCYLSQKWGCENFDGNKCYCSYYWDAGTPQYRTTVCNNVPDANGPWRCCNSNYGSCDCTLNGAACKAGETEVADCAVDTALGYSAAPSGCPAGQHSVNGCS